MLVRYAVLAVLSDGELHGYAIKAEFQRHIGTTWSLNFGQIYDALKRLKLRGLLTARFDGNGGHLGRWVYAITPKGRTVLSTWLKRRPAGPAAVRNEIFIRLLASSGDSAAALGQLAEQQRVYERHLAELRSQAIVGEPVFVSLVRDAEAFRIKAHLLWLEHAMDAVARRRDAGRERKSRSWDGAFAEFAVAAGAECASGPAQVGVEMCLSSAED